MTRAVLRPLVPLYAAAVALKNSLYDNGILHPEKLAWPVVSIGNLSVGGTGKTPFVRELARLLGQRGRHADVLTRGHGRRSKQVERVDAAGPASRYGDEPLMLARSGVPVFVGSKRYEAGALAEAQQEAVGDGKSAVHLLDDGMQHRKLARDVEIVLLDRRDLSDAMLPAGRLREPVKSLRRADICVLREGDRDLSPWVMRAMQTENAERVWIQQRKTRVQGQISQRLVAFCGIANAEQFFRGLRHEDISLVGEIAFPDHYVYTPKDASQLLACASASQADGFVTTEKDRMRLEGPLLEALTSVAPVHIATLAVSLCEPERYMHFLETLLDNRAGVR